MKDLSVIIPARNEEFLEETVNNVLQNKKADTEVIVLLDGDGPNIISYKDVKIIRNDKPIGQRACVNLGVKNSDAKFVMKLDAHCSVDKGFDEKLMADYEPDWTVVPRMYNLHAFNWECDNCGHETMQGPEPKQCKSCGDKANHTKKIIWKPKRHKRSDYMLFDSDMKFGYWYERNRDPKRKKKMIDDQLCAVGACFFMSRERYWELEGMDEAHGGWGQMGVEVACKSWLSGGKQVVNKNTWFAHMFRTNNKGFSFPYPMSGKDQQKAKRYSQKLWKGNKWPKAVKSLSWLINHFAPVPGWEIEKKPEKTNLTPAPTVKNRPLPNKSPQLSVIIPARNEKYLQNTLDDIYKNFTSDYEIIVALDDYIPDPPIEDHSNLRILTHDKRQGMRKLINHAVSKAKGYFIMKTDAHCSFDKGYDQKLMSMCNTSDTVLGIRYELDVKEWKRKERTNCDFRYLSPLDDPKGGLRGLPWHEWKKDTKGQKIAESMSLSGSGWMMEKRMFDGIGGLDDENYGTMYQEGVEIACKTWLSGGRLLINRDTWYAHWNRGKAPYALSTKHRQKSIDYSIDQWVGNNWPLQKYSFNWLLNKFNPPGWPRLKHEGLPAKRQGTNLKGCKGLLVDELWEKRLGISEPLKRYRLELFFDAFMEFIHAEVLQDEEGVSLDPDYANKYINYLISHRNKTATWTATSDDYEYAVKKAARSKKLYQSIKKKGMMTPLEFYQKDGKLILFRGYRRLVILKALGIKKVAARVHKTEHVAKKLNPGYSWSKGSITELGAKQFAKYSSRATDKHYVHNYLPTYDKLFSHLRIRPIKLLEIGLLYGASLALWHDAFPKAKLYGLDKNVTMWKKMIKGLNRIDVTIGMQQNKKTLAKVAKKGPFDIIIDDCGHNPENQMTSLRVLWSSLKDGGFYVMEDCYHSFKPGWTGTNVPFTFASWIASIYGRDDIDGQVGLPFEIKSVQFYYNMCVVEKGATS